VPLVTPDLSTRCAHTLVLLPAVELYGRPTPRHLPFSIPEEGSLRDTAREAIRTGPPAGATSETGLSAGPPSDSVRPPPNSL